MKFSLFMALPIALSGLPMVAAAMTAQPASEVRDSACITASVGTAGAERLFAAATRRPRPDRETMSAVILRPARRCAARLRWSAARLQVATVESMSVMLGHQASLLLARNGIQVATLDRWFHAQNGDFRATLDLSTVANLGLTQALVADGVDQSIINANMMAVSTYLAHLMLKERIARGLPLDSF